MVAPVEMERWRSYFGKAGADIWTVIQHAISIAAIDYPMDFRERRAEIAETLFARNLVIRHSRASNHDSKLIHPEELDARDSHALRDSETRPRQSRATRSLALDGGVDDVTLVHHYSSYANGDDSAHKDLHSYHEEAEPSLGELEKDALLIRDIDGIKANIMNEDQSENVLVEALQRLQYVQITVGALKATEIGKQVKVLKKHPSKRVRGLVKELVRQWKDIVDEWANSTKDGTTAAVETRALKTDPEGRPKAQIQDERLPLPQPDNDAQLEAGAPPMDLSKLFSFVDGELCTEDKDSRRHSTSIEPSVKDNLNYLSRSQSGSLLTDSSDFDTKASTNYPWGHRTPEERGSATRDVYPPLGKLDKETIPLKGQIGQHGKAYRDMDGGWGSQSSKVTANGTNPGRQCTEALKGKPTSGGKQVNCQDGVNRVHVVPKSAAIHKTDKDRLVDQKLEIAKRKLHQGYQQAENAKKQRVIQVLDFPEGVKAGGQLVKGKVNPPVQNRGVATAQCKNGFQMGNGSQNRRFS